MKRRFLPGIAVVMLFTTACGDRVQIGSQGDSTLPPPPNDACVGLTCGESCPLTTCSTNECPPSVGGTCNADGACTLDTPVCPAPPLDPRCAGIACGVLCNLCDPASPSCSTDLDAGAPEPAMLCDAFQQCQAGPVACP